MARRRPSGRRAGRPAVGGGVAAVHGIVGENIAGECRPSRGAAARRPRWATTKTGVPRRRRPTRNPPSATAPPARAHDRPRHRRAARCCPHSRFQKVRTSPGWRRRSSGSPMVIQQVIRQKGAVSATPARPHGRSLPALVEDGRRWLTNFSSVSAGGGRGSDLHPQRQVERAGRHDLPVVRAIGVGRAGRAARRPVAAARRTRRRSAPSLRTSGARTSARTPCARAARSSIRRVLEVHRHHRQLVVLVDDDVEPVGERRLRVGYLHGPLILSHEADTPTGAWRQLVVIALAEFLGMTLWFSATSVTPALSPSCT